MMLYSTSSNYANSTQITIQEKAYSEVKEVIGESDITIESLRKLKLVKNIFKEALRLYPPVSFITRESLLETTMRNKTIKPDDTIVISPWLIHRHSDYWKNPDEFDPFRFNTRNEHGAYLPFGKGSRVCVGAAFAEQEAMIVIASVLLKYRVELEGSFVPQPVCQITTRSKNGMKVRLYKR